VRRAECREPLIRRLRARVTRSVRTRPPSKRTRVTTPARGGRNRIGRTRMRPTRSTSTRFGPKYQDARPERMRWRTGEVAR
jgi:hypothetical protein